MNLKSKANKAGVTPTSLLLTCFGEILGKWSKKSHFTLNLTLFNPISFHEQVSEIVGDFTSLTLLEIDFRESKPFLEKIKQVQQQLWKDLEHRYFTGVELESLALLQ